MSSIRILFHGTAHNITRFDESSIGKGSDPNSALGVHSTDDILYSVEYAERSKALDENAKECEILVLSYKSHDQKYMSEYEEFYGDDLDDTNTHEHFKEIRSDLLEDNIDLVDFDGGEESITTLLDTNKIDIIERLTVKEAKSLAEFVENHCIAWSETDRMLDALHFIKNKNKN